MKRSNENVMIVVLRMIKSGSFSKMSTVSVPPSLVQGDALSARLSPGTAMGTVIVESAVSEPVNPESEIDGRHLGWRSMETESSIEMVLVVQGQGEDCEMEAVS